MATTTKSKKKKLAPAEVIERNVAMFKAWLRGARPAELAQQFNLSIWAVKRTAERNRWTELRKQLRKREYERSMEVMLGTSAMATDLLDKDIRKIYASVRAENRQLTKEERDHVRAYQDRLWKEARLHDGKPTENHGPVQVQVVVPPGGNPWGVVPLPQGTKFVESTVETKKTNLSIEDVLKEDGDDE